LLEPIHFHNVVFRKEKRANAYVIVCVFIILHENIWHEFYYFKKCCNFGKLLTLCYAKEFKITRKFMQWP
jgi:hypothetical protein